MREPGPARTFFASSKKRPCWPERANAVDAIYQLREREEARLLEVAHERRVQPRGHRVASLGRLRDKPLLGEGRWRLSRIDSTVAVQRNGWDFWL